MDLQLFNYEENEIRLVTIDGVCWWVAKDICTALFIKNVSQALSKLYKEEKGVFLISTPGGNQNLLCVNESGLYTLVFSSRKTKATKFKRWVMSEVLPSIRKTGSYSVEKQIEAPKKNQVEKIKSNPLLAQAKLFLEMAQKQSDNEQKLISHESKLEAIEQQLKKGGDPRKVSHFTIRAWSRLKGFSLTDDSFAGMISRKLKPIAEGKGLELEEEEHSIFGKILKYPRSILESHFEPFYDEVKARKIELAKKKAEESEEF